MPVCCAMLCYGKERVSRVLHLMLVLRDEAWPIVAPCCSYRRVEALLMAARRWGGDAALASASVEQRVIRVDISPLAVEALPPEEPAESRLVRLVRDISKTHLGHGVGVLEGRLAVVSFVSGDGRALAQHKRAASADVFCRTRRFLEGGLRIGGRKYSPLAFSNSQLKSSSWWFWCGEPSGDQVGLSASELRAALGDLSHISQPSKYAARLGQNFSTTQTCKAALISSHEDSAYYTRLREIPDVESAYGAAERRPMLHSDGCSTISSDLLHEIIAEQVSSGSRFDPPPSCLQFRIGGAKGMVSVDPSLGPGRVLCLRDSQIKFTMAAGERLPRDQHLEINEWARYQEGYLNQQILLLLETRFATKGVPDLMDAHAASLSMLTTSAEAALSQLPRTQEGSDLIFPAMRGLLEAGVAPADDAFLFRALSARQSHGLRSLREKARIFVPLSCRLKGVLDEQGVLKEGECFVQVWKPGALAAQVIESKHAFFVKQPCLHTGDLRTVHLVDNEKLHHLHNVIVFSRKGPRPLQSESANGDLDGDDYFICWEPSIWPAMDAEPSEPAGKRMGARGGAEAGRRWYMSWARADRRARSMLAARHAHGAAAMEGPRLQLLEGARGTHAMYLATAATAAAPPQWVCWCHVCDMAVDAGDIECHERSAEHVAALDRRRMRDVSAWFRNYIVQDNLGHICTLHMRLADAIGLRSADCLELQALATIAVDFGKFGVPALLPARLERHPRLPEEGGEKVFPDFMAKPGRRTYESEKLLGQVYLSGSFRTRAPLLVLSACSSC